MEKNHYFTKHTYTVGAVALIAGAVLGYAGGHAIAAKNGNLAQGAYGGGMMRGTTGAFTRAGMMGGLLSGTVASMGTDSITIDTRDGSSHVILLSPSTTVQKSVSGALSDVATGSTVLVMGTPNSDGSISATSIQLRPAGAMPAPQTGK